MKTIYIFLFGLLLFPFASLSQSTLNVSVSGIRSNSGNIRLAVYCCNDDFNKNKPLMIKTVPKSQMSKGVLKTSWSLKPGTYGIAILDDENGNKQMDYGLVMPKEGFGFSDYYHTGMSKPTFDKFKFTVNEAEAKSVKIKVRYL